MYIQFLVPEYRACAEWSWICCAKHRKGGPCRVQSLLDTKMSTFQHIFMLSSLQKWVVALPARHVPVLLAGMAHVAALCRSQWIASKESSCGLRYSSWCRYLVPARTGQPAGDITLAGSATPHFWVRKAWILSEHCTKNLKSVFLGMRESPTIVADGEWTAENLSVQPRGIHTFFG